MFRMFKEALVGFSSEPAVVALVLFCVVFAALTAAAWRRSRREHYEYMSNLPLEGRDHHER